MLILSDHYPECSKGSEIYSVGIRFSVIVHRVRISETLVMFDLITADHMFVLDQNGDIEAFNMRANPALKTNVWSSNDELGESFM